MQNRFFLEGWNNFRIYFHGSGNIHCIQISECIIQFQTAWKLISTCIIQNFKWIRFILYLQSLNLSFSNVEPFTVDFSFFFHFGGRASNQCIDLSSNKSALHFAIDAMPFINQTEKERKKASCTLTCGKLNIVCLVQTGISQMPTLQSRWIKIVIGLIKYSIHINKKYRVRAREKEQERKRDGKKTHKQSTRKSNECRWMSVVYIFFLVSHDAANMQ